MPPDGFHSRADCSISKRNNLWFNKDMATSTVGVDERAPLANGVVIGDVLDGEERSREATRERNEKLNLPGGDVPVGADRVDEREMSAFGGIQAYLEYEMGGPDFANKPDFDEAEFLRNQWAERMGDKECPDLDDPRDGPINMEIMRAILDREVTAQMMEAEERECGYKLEGGGDPVDVKVDLSRIKNLDLREALERVGGEKYIEEVLRTAVRMILTSPASENFFWWIKLETPGDKFLKASLRDFSGMFVVGTDGDEKEVILPEPGDGDDMREFKNLVVAIHRLRLNGASLQKHVGLEIV